jgi:hypothetical protein
MLSPTKGQQQQLRQLTQFFMQRNQAQNAADTSNAKHLPIACQSQ